MNDLPRRPIPPVPPPVGSFERTLARARARRRKAIAGLASASAAVCAVVVVAATVSIGHSNTGSRPPTPIAPVDSSPTATASSPTSNVSSPTPSPAAVTSASAWPVVSPSTSRPQTTSPSLSSSPVSSAPASPAPAVYRGRLTDAAHHPLKSYYLYWVVTDTAKLGNPAATTRDDGAFEVACPRTKGSALAISSTRVPPGSESWLYSPIAGQPNEAAVFYTGATSILSAIDVTHGCATHATVTTTIYRPHGIITGTVSIDGKPYSAADAARNATAQPGDPGSDLGIFVEITSPNGVTEMDGLFPAPDGGAFSLSGLGTGDVVFHVASSTVRVPVVDGQSVKVAIAITMGASPTGGDATATVTVVP